MRDGVLACAALALASGCLAPEPTSVATLEARSLLLATFVEGNLTGLALTPGPDQPGQGWTQADGVALGVVPLPYSPEELQLAPGPLVIPPPGRPARSLPPDSTVWFLVEGALERAEDQGPWLTPIRLPPFDGGACAAALGCLGEVWPYCNLTCTPPSIDPPAPPTMPEPARLSRGGCAGTETAFLDGSCLDANGTCDPTWPAELLGRADVWFADADAGAGGDGSADRPWSTLAIALAQVPAGATIALRGTFDEPVRLTQAVTLRGLCPGSSAIRANQEAAVTVQGAEVELRALSLSGGTAVSAQGGAVNLDGLHLTGRVGIDQVGGTVTIHTLSLTTTGTGAWVRGGEMSGSGLELAIEDGTGLITGPTATVTLQGIGLHGQPGARRPFWFAGRATAEALWADGQFGSGSMITAGAAVLRDLRLAADSGGALRVLASATVSIERAEISGADSFGLKVEGAALEAHDLTITDIRPGDDAVASCLAGHVGPPVVITRLAVTRCPHGVLFDTMADLANSPVTLTDVTATECSLDGIQFEAGRKRPGEFHLERVAVRQVAGAGLRSRRYSIPTMIDVDVEDALDSGLDVGSEYEVTVTRARVRRASPQAYRADLSQFTQFSTGRHTLRDVELGGTGPDSDALGLYFLRGSFEAERLWIHDLGVGLLVSGILESRVSNSLIEDNRVGMDLTSTEEDLSLLPGVVLRDNGLDLAP